MSQEGTREKTVHTLNNTIAPLSDDKLIEFMLEEYRSIRERRKSLEQVGENRVNFFLATISGSIVGLGLISQIPNSNDIPYLITVAVFVGLIWIGFTIFSRVVSRSINLILLDRGMNKIRRYFADRNPEIIDYLSFPINDDKPSFGYSIMKAGKYNLKGLPPMMAIINGIVIFTGTVILSRVIFGFNAVLSMGIGIVIFILVITAQYRYYVNQVKSEATKQKSKVRFPTKPGSL